MEDLLIKTLESFGYDVIRQGSMAPDEEYPDHFFTFWENQSYDGSHYNNDNVSTVYDYDVNFYSIDPDAVYTKLREAKALLKSKGFITSGDGHAVASDEDSHTGRGMNVLYLKF